MQRVAVSPDLSLSRMVYGLWRLTNDADQSTSHVQAKIEACLAQGLTTLDHADIYGRYRGEAALGRALKAAPRLRDQIEIITKCDIVTTAAPYASARVKHYDTSAGHIERSVDRSLKELSTDRIDLLLLHRPDPLMDHRETGPALEKMIASGKVRAVGVSNFKPHDFSLLQSAMQTRLVTNQIELSLLASEPFTNGDLAWLQEHAIAPMAWSPLAGGRLFAAGQEKLTARLEELGRPFGADASAVAIAWLLRHPGGILPVMGANSLHRIARFADAFRVEMDRQDWFELYELARGKEVA